MDLEQALAEIENLKAKLSKFDGVDPDQVTRDRQSLSDQLANTQRQFNEFKAAAETEKQNLVNQLTAKEIQYKLNDALSAAGVLPEYRDRFGDLSGAMELRDNQLWLGGKEFNAIELREKYPALFAAVQDGAGSGATGSTAVSSGGSSPQVVTSDNGIIAGVSPDAVLKGEVVIK